MIVPADSAGKLCRCPRCQNTFHVPASKTTTKSPAFEKRTQETSLHTSEYPLPNSYHSSTPFYPPSTPKKNKLGVIKALLIVAAGVTATASIVGAVYGLLAIASQVSFDKHSDSKVELLDFGGSVSPRPTTENTSHGAAQKLSNDRMVDVALQFVALAQVPNSWEAIRLLDEASFEKRTKGEKGSAKVQANGI